MRYNTNKQLGVKNVTRIMPTKNTSLKKLEKLLQEKEQSKRSQNI